MVTYAIGDIQGCGASLHALLARLPLRPEHDALWFAGDVVNRGPRSLDALRTLVALSAEYGERCVCVLGNHDLHLLARAEGLVPTLRGDTLDDILAAPDRDALLDWLRHRPLLHRERLPVTVPPDRDATSAPDAAPRSDSPRERPATPGRGATLAGPALREHVLVHAGLDPRWSVDEAARLGAEVQAALAGPEWRRTLAAITQTSPERWDAALAGDERLAAVAAVLTRLRTCRADGRLCRNAKGPPSEAPSGCTPWYEVTGRGSRGARVVFGHWAALGLHLRDDAACLDSGCVWGGPLTALRLEDDTPFQQPNIEAG
ncbi:MAG TPA: diadenosine tetraphosphatase [Planctomycetota bacterium]|nr:diadenosine tetraphosphatase [Planctomycetota bacterium]